MADSVHISQRRKVRINSPKNKKDILTVLAARYVSGFTIAITISSGMMRIVNFLPLFEKYVKGDNLRYFAPERFKKFAVKNGNVYWGKNEDVIFPVELLLKGLTAKVITEKILYII